MAELMLVNPRRKRRKTRRKLTAKQAKYFGPRRKRRRARVAAAARPARRHRRRSRVVAAAPHRRRRRSTSRRRVTRLRRNPLRMPHGFNSKRFLSDTLIPAGIGAGGALGVDIALGYFGSYLPASLQTGLPNVAVKLAAAVGVGMAAGAVGGKRMGEQVTAGAVIVTLYSLLKAQIMSAVPSLPLHGYNMGWVSPALQVGPGMSAYVGNDHAYGGGGMGVYIGENESDYY